MLEGSIILAAPKNLRDFVLQKIETPIKYPEIFSHPFLPAKKLFLVYGREGVGKYTSLIHLLEQKKEILQVNSFPMVGNSEGNFDAFLNKFKNSRSQLPTVWILEHGQNLLKNSCVTVEQIPIVTNLLALIQKTPHYLVVLFDDPPAPHESNKFETDFFNQFQETLFVPSPDATTRQAYLKHRMEQLDKHFKSVKVVDVSLDLQEEDWEWLARTCSTFCTFLQIDEWCKKLFYRYALPNRPPAVINRALLEDENNRHITRAMGAPSITAQDTQAIEASFKQFSGQIDPIMVLKEKEQDNMTLPISDANKQKINVWGELYKESPGVEPEQKKIKKQGAKNK